MGLFYAYGFYAILWLYSWDVDAMRYRKRPVVIEAWQNSDESEFPEWVDNADVGREPGGVILINTLEGVMKAMPSDYIIKGVQGEIYPCKPDIFLATYEAVE